MSGSMQQDRLSRIARRLSVGATSAVLVLSAAGAAHAHPLSVNPAIGTDTEREALAALILRYEPFEDPSTLYALVDQILVSWPGAGTFALGILDADSDDEDESEVEVPDVDDDESEVEDDATVDDNDDAESEDKDDDEADDEADDENDGDDKDSDESDDDHDDGDSDDEDDEDDSDED